jgi:hypothetical protein
MSKLTPFKLALILGWCTEGVLVAAMAAFGRLGPCGPSNGLTGIIMLLHLPGILLASPIAAASSTRPELEPITTTVATAVAIAMGAMTFTTISYLFTRRLRRFKSLRRG